MGALQQHLQLQTSGQGFPMSLLMVLRGQGIAPGRQEESPERRCGLGCHCRTAAHRCHGKGGQGLARLGSFGPFGRHC